MDTRLVNTLNAWRQHFIMEGHNVEKAWNSTQQELTDKQLHMYDNFEDFASDLKMNKDEVLENYYVVGGLNTIINDDKTVNQNIETVKNMGYEVGNKEYIFKKTIENGQVVEVNDYMLTTHTTPFLEKVIKQIEQEAVR